MKKTDPKKEALQKIRDTLEQERNALQSKINRNKFEMNRLAAQNTVMKRERAKISELLRNLS